MVMQYWGKKINVNDIIEVVGYPPFQSYSHPKLNQWMKRNHGIRFRYLYNSNIEDAKDVMMNVNLGKIPVKKNDEIIGLVTQKDILNYVF